MPPSERQGLRREGPAGPDEVGQQRESLARKLARGAGLILAAVIPATLLFGALAPASTVEHAAEGGIACFFLAVTGIPCPFCGMTHATLALGQGDVAGALAHHPLAPLVLLLTFGAALYLVRGKTPRLLGAKLTPIAILAIVAVIWAVKLVA